MNFTQILINGITQILKKIINNYNQRGLILIYNKMILIQSTKTIKILMINFNNKKKKIINFFKTIMILIRMTIYNGKDFHLILIILIKINKIKKIMEDGEALLKVK